jgi:cytochrome c oxidase assembly protein subunit 11
VTRRANQYVVVGGLLLAVAGMLCLVSYSVTLYRLFCEATGAGGYTQRVASDTAKMSDRFVTVYFDSNVAPNLPWRFEPAQRSVRVRLGEETPVFFTAENLSDQPLVGHATYNVTPEKVGSYFKKIECFCFTEERLEAHTKVDMPVLFYVDPAMATEPNTADVREITLSYTFFRTDRPNDPLDLARFDGAPGPEAGAALFASQCSACHAPDTTKVGPKLGGVIGRRAGSVPGYPYTKALAGADVVWSAQTLDRWLTNPKAMVPGTAMPMAIDDAKARQSIIAYLTQLSPNHPVLRDGGS